VKRVLWSQTCLAGYYCSLGLESPVATTIVTIIDRQITGTCANIWPLLGVFSHDQHNSVNFNMSIQDHSALRAGAASSWAIYMAFLAVLALFNLI
jgi:hypothetical protein